MAAVVESSLPSSFHLSSKPVHGFGTVPTFSAPVKWSLPQSRWQPLCHPLEQEISREVDSYFLDHWPFPNGNARKKFLAAGFSKVTCYYFPKAQGDRIHFACRLLTVLFLIDDVLEDMSFTEGEAYNERLIPISRGHMLPDRSVPAEYIIYDLWESMRAHDKALADEVLEPTFTFMRAQTDRSRLTIGALGEYLTYREKDVGKALLSALMRFSMGLNLSTAELASTRAIEENCSKHISVVNDVYSWEKELLASQMGHSEGAALCSAVQVLGDETNLNVAATKRVLWNMIREWELVHDELCAARMASEEGCSVATAQYMEGLKYQMSGNERWSQTTPRYNSATGV